MTTAGSGEGSPAVRRTYPHQVLAAIAAALFGLFVVGGVVALVGAWPSTSCAGVAPTHSSSDKVELAGSSPGWKGVPGNDCVEVISADNPPRAYDLGPAPVIHSGTGWDYARLAIVAWIAWTLAMTLLALAVAKLPSHSSATSARG